jgi:hypothetical protein
LVNFAIYIILVLVERSTGASSAASEQMQNMNRRDFLGRIGLTAGSLLILQSGCVIEAGAESLSDRKATSSSAEKSRAEFASPPFDCGPWVYWFWLDVNVTREGITADLEAMKAVGIVGVLIMDVDQGAPPSFNDSRFGDSEWYALFKFACQEADRLGIQVNMNNDAGFCGSGGPWITPELSMQAVVWSGTAIAGGKTVNTTLQQPKAKLNFYRDIAVLAFPTPAADLAGRGYRIPNINDLSDSVHSHYNAATQINWENIPADQLVPRSGILDLTEKMDEHGVLRCELPAGGWTILRFGHTTTGVQNHPAPAGGMGLEADTLSRTATLLQFDALMERIIKTVGPLLGKTLVSTHIDSWESGTQNWTPAMREEFQRRRGYDLLPYMPILTGQVVESLETSQRFLWDFRSTIGDLLLENYAAAMREVAHKHGLRLSIEGYSGEPANDVRYGGEADEPMAECWTWPRFNGASSVREMTSAGHVYGHNVIAQETFTANGLERWLGHPAVVKDIGDWTFCEGINRFVFHRYAMQPWTNPHYAPGMSMGPWGLHYERTQTWWNMSKAWHDYVARCSYMLRQGHFVADVCYMEAEGGPRQISDTMDDPRRPGYNFDVCPAELVLERMEYKDGFLTLPGGMKYRILVLPDSPTMTPQLLGKVKRLVDAGALVIGSKPGKSPSLIGYPQCDAEVQRLADELWDNKKVISGTTAAEILKERGIKPDFECDQSMVRWIHRHTEDMDIYFVANGAVTETYPYAGWPMVANCSFRVTDAKPEIWDPESGLISSVSLYDTFDGMTRIPVLLSAKGSAFVVFRHNQSHSHTQILRSISRNEKTLLRAGDELVTPQIEILSAVYGKLGDAQHTRDASEDVRKLVESGELTFPVSKIGDIGGDPDPGVSKDLDIRCRINDHEYRFLFHDRDWADFSVPGEYPPATSELDRDGSLQLRITKPGDYRCILASGKAVTISVPSPVPVQIQGPWTVKFPEGWSAPTQVQFEKLIPWNEHSDLGVRFFSGTASYHCNFHVPEDLLTADHSIELDLGDVAVMADVMLNGRSMGTLWKSPFRIDVTAALRAGENTLEITVANLWVNRMIGDQHLPADADRNPNGTLARWPQWLLDGKASPTGRFTFTTWELWHKTDSLMPSGLIGPVRLLTTVRKRLNL